MKVLVTGAAGYVGSVFCARLLEDPAVRVRAVDNFTYGNHDGVRHLLGHPRYEFCRVDVRDGRALRPLAAEADVVVSLAALVGMSVCEKLPLDAQAVNADSVRQLASWLSPRQRLVYANTNSGYGQTDGVTMVTEDDTLTPISVYGVTKCAGERHALAHGNAVSFRLATAFGVSPRMRLDLLVNDWTDRLARGDVLSVYEPQYARNFVHVRDVAEALYWGCTNHYLSGPYNLGMPDANLTKWQLARRICSVLGVAEDRVQPGSGRDPDQRNYRVSNARILSAGFRFQHTLEGGIRDVAALRPALTAEDRRRMRNQ